MTSGREYLRHQQAVAVILGLHGDVIDVACFGSFTPLREADAVRTDPTHGVSAPARRKANRDCAVGRRSRFPVRSVRNVEAMRRFLLEHVHALAEFAPVLIRSGEGRLSLHQTSLSVVSRVRSRGWYLPRPD